MSPESHLLPCKRLHVEEPEFEEFEGQQAVSNQPGLVFTTDCFIT